MCAVAAIGTTAFGGVVVPEPSTNYTMSTPIKRDNETLIWSANQIFEVEEAIRLSEELAAFDLVEITCLAINIYFEARSEPIEGQVAVAWVTLNRRDAEGFRDTVCIVVHQYMQFSWTHDGK